MTSYIGPTVSALALTTGSVGGAIPTLGGATITLSGAFFGPPASGGFAASTASITFGPTGVEFACGVTAITQSSMTCVTGVAAGAGLPIRVVVGGQAAVNTSDAFGAPLALSCIPPLVRLIAPGDGSVALGSLSTLGGQTILLNGSNFGPSGSVLLAAFVSSGGSGINIPLASCAHAPAAPHTQATCVTAAGAGANLSVVS